MISPHHLLNPPTTHLNPHPTQPQLPHPLMENDPSITLVTISRIQIQVVNNCLPKGVHAVEGMVEHTSTAWELDDTEAVFALLAGSADAEGLELATIDEAKT